MAYRKRAINVGAEHQHDSHYRLLYQGKISNRTITSPVTSIQRRLGNRDIQRLIAQRSGGGPVELDDELTARINHQRGGGQALSEPAQQQMGASLGADFSGVRVHTSTEADALNQQLNARAFTTGQDIFFRSGEYQPGSSGGQELLAHELTHVVQQSSGAVGLGGTAMTVNPPGDQFEQEADAVARKVLQRQLVEGEIQEQIQPLIDDQEAGRI
jgi:hypothetical protein